MRDDGDPAAREPASWCSSALVVVALLAWQRRLFESARSEGPLPDPSLDTRGAGSTVAALALLVALPGIPMAVVAALPKLTHHRISGYLPPELLEPILTVYAITLYPELLRRALAHREGSAPLRPRASITAIASAPLEYVANTGPRVTRSCATAGHSSPPSTGESTVPIRIHLS